MQPELANAELLDALADAVRQRMERDGLPSNHAAAVSAGFFNTTMHRILQGSGGTTGLHLMTAVRVANWAGYRLQLVPDGQPCH